MTARWFALVLLLVPSLAFAESRRPNVVFFLVDDLGWADLGCYGSTFYRTPNIDGLANRGVRFTQAYAACPVCSPTRASIMTGRHPVRVDITDWIPGLQKGANSDVRFEHVDDRDDLALDEVTIAEHLQSQADYQTFFIGKWHLGDRGNYPTDQGFDVNIGGCDKGSPPGGYYAPFRNPSLTNRDDDDYLPTRLTDEAVKLIAGAESSRPFFMMFSFYNVHTPIQPDRSTVDEYQKIAKEKFTGATPTSRERKSISRGRQDNPEYASMVTAVDTSVGRVLVAIEDAGLRDDTIVVFFSDNGGLCTLASGRKKGALATGGPTSNLPLRSGKGWLYEGGVREPLIILAPGQMNVGVCDTPVISTDFFPTILDLVGLPQAPELHADGTSIKPLLVGESIATRNFYWHYPHYHGSGWTPGASIRSGDWKLIEFYETDQTELYNLANDPGEREDLASTNVENRDRLKRALSDWQTKMNAKMPVERKGP